MATSQLGPTDRIARNWRGVCASSCQRRASVVRLAYAVALGVLLSSTLVAQDRPPAPEASDSSVESKVTVAAYSTEVDPDQAADRLRLQFGGNPQVKIVVDPRTRRILTQAPAAIQSQVAAELQRMEQNATAVPSSTQQTADSENRGADEDPKVAWAPRQTTELQGRLQNLAWPTLLESLRAMTPDRKPIAPTRTAEGWRAELPSAKGPTTMNLNPRTGHYQLVGTPELTDAWGQAIRSLDKQTTAPTTQLVPIKKASPATIDRAMTVLEHARTQVKSMSQRWGADVVGIAPQGTRQPVEVAQAPQAPQSTDNQGGDQGDDQVEVQIPTNPQPGDVGVDGSLIGPVQIEYVEGLDAIIIRGRKQDVDRVMGIIDEIEELSTFTEPKIELVPLKHVNSQAMSEMVTQLNAQSNNVRLGTVNITPLVKPNALILIGREEGVDATIDLIERLDQPVAPSTQFHIFRLKYIPATDAANTITTFFQDRGGLAPRIQVQADFRTNSLIVYASPRDLEEVQQLLVEIDVTENAAESEVRVFKLNNALAEELAPVLEATLRGEAAPATGGQFGGGGQGGATATGVSARSTTLTMTRIDTEGNRVLKSGILTEVRVAADVRANSLVVTAPAESMELIAALVQQLDELPTSEAEIKVFTIENGDAASLTDMLNELFGQNQQGNQAQQLLQSAIGAGESTLVPLRFSTDLRTNSIIATGSGADLRVVEAILLRLDESDVTLRRTRVYRLQNAPASEVSTAINQYLQTQRQITLGLAPETLSPFEQIEREVVVVPELVSNSLIISATPRYFEEIAKIVQDLDSQPPMVLIQVLIAEVDLENNEEFGVELGIQDSLLFDRSVVGDTLSPGFNFANQALGNAGSAASLATRENLAGQGVSSFALGRSNSQLGYGGLVLSASSESINILLRALQVSRRLDILSRPQVMTLNNQPAFVLVGQRVPRITDVQINQNGTVNSTQLENVGLVLGVTPRISPDGLVVMEIDAEKSELGNPDDGIPIAIQDGEVIKSPIIDTTVAQTTVSARSGQTVILGGLITKSHTSISRRVPYLSDVPLLGHLFRFDGEADLRTELLIIMTPYIVRKAEDAEWLNQIEAQRMSWCLADVINVHGDVGMGITSPGPNNVIPEGINVNDFNTPAEVVVPGVEESSIPSLENNGLLNAPYEGASTGDAPIEVIEGQGPSSFRNRFHLNPSNAPTPEIMTVPEVLPESSEIDRGLPAASRETRVISPVQY